MAMTTRQRNRAASYLRSLTVAEIETLLSNLSSVMQDNVYTFLTNSYKAKNDAMKAENTVVNTLLDTTNNLSDPLLGE